MKLFLFIILINVIVFLALYIVIVIPKKYELYGAIVVNPTDGTLHAYDNKSYITSTQEKLFVSILKDRTNLYDNINIQMSNIAETKIVLNERHKRALGTFKLFGICSSKDEIKMSLAKLNIDDKKFNDNVIILTQENNLNVSIHIVSTTNFEVYFSLKLPYKINSSDGKNQFIDYYKDINNENMKNIEQNISESKLKLIKYQIISNIIIFTATIILRILKFRLNIH